MSNQVKTPTLNIWRASKQIKFSYLRPEVVVGKDEFLFLIDITPDVMVFKTENNQTVILPSLTNVVKQVF